MSFHSSLFTHGICHASIIRFLSPFFFPSLSPFYPRLIFNQCCLFLVPFLTSFSSFFLSLSSFLPLSCVPFTLFYLMYLFIHLYICCISPFTHLSTYLFSLSNYTIYLSILSSIYPSIYLFTY